MYMSHLPSLVLRREMRDRDRDRNRDRDRDRDRDRYVYVSSLFARLAKRGEI